MYEWMSQDSPISMCSICMNECLKIRPYVCAAYVWMNFSRFAHIYVQHMNERMPYDSPISMCRICRTVLRFAHILHVQDMHEYQIHDDTTTNPLYTQHRRSTVRSYLHSLLPANQLTTGATSTQIPCDINIKCSGMLRPVERRSVTDFSTKPIDAIILVTQEGIRVLRNVVSH
jgi:hypothetical protein